MRTYFQKALLLALMETSNILINLSYIFIWTYTGSIQLLAFQSSSSESSLPFLIFILPFSALFLGISMPTLTSLLIKFIVGKSSFSPSSSNPTILSIAIPSSKHTRVGKTWIYSLLTKKGAFSASSLMNLVSVCTGAILWICMSIILHLSKSLWKKAHTTYWVFVTWGRKSPSVISRYWPCPSVLFVCVS